MNQGLSGPSAAAAKPQDLSSIQGCVLAVLQYALAVIFGVWIEGSSEAPSPVLQPLFLMSSPPVEPLPEGQKPKQDNT